MSYEEVVRTLATGLAKRYKLPGGDSLADEVLAREKIGTTVLMEGPNPQSPIPKPHIFSKKK